MNFRNALKGAARFILANGREPVHVEVCTLDAGSLLSNRKIIITGGGRGLGYAMAEAAIRQGADVCIAGRDESALRHARASLGERCQFVPFDIADANRSFDFLLTADKLLGGADTLICNAGISLHEGQILRVTPEQFDSQFDVNFRGTYFLAQAFIKLVLDKREANILFVSSDTADKCCDIPYGLTKSAVSSLTGALSRRYYRSGIRVNAIAPGVTATDMTRAACDTSKGDYSYGAPSGRAFLPEEVAEVAVFMISDLSRCISGEVIHTNAGNHLSVPLNFKDAYEG